MGELRWITVVSPEALNEVELALEPNANPASQTIQKAIFEHGIPQTAFAVNNTQQEYERLRDLGITFSMEPTDIGTTIIAVFEDTCGNLIQIFQAESK